MSKSFDTIYLYDKNHEKTEALQKCYDYLESIKDEHYAVSPRWKSVCSLEMTDDNIIILKGRSYQCDIEDWQEWKENHCPELLMAIDSRYLGRFSKYYYEDGEFFKDFNNVIIRVYDNNFEQVDELCCEINENNHDKLVEIAEYLYPNKPDLMDKENYEVIGMIEKSDQADVDQYVLYQPDQVEVLDEDIPMGDPSDIIAAYVNLPDLN